MNQNFAARWVNVILGAWLFISAFAWEHSSAQFNNAWIVGVAATVIAAVAMRFEQLRYANAVLAGWLFIAAFALPRMTMGTWWNGVLVAIAMLLASLRSNSGGGPVPTPTAGAPH